MTTSTTIGKDGILKLSHEDAMPIIQRYARTHYNVSPDIIEGRAAIGSGKVGERADYMGWIEGGHDATMDSRRWVPDVLKVEYKASKSDAQRDKDKWHNQYNDWGMGTLRVMCAPAGLLDRRDIPDHWGHWEITDDLQVHEVIEPTRIEKHDRNRELLILLNALRKQQKREAVEGRRGASKPGGASFPDKLADAIQNTLGVYGPLRFADIWKLCDELRMHAAFGGKRHKAQKALDEALDQGRIKGFGVVPNVTPTVYTVEMSH